MDGRTASVRLQGYTSPSAELLCGLHQGSPISPILFLLYTEPIYRLQIGAAKYGYADDVAMLFTGDSLDDTTEQANAAVSQLVEWGQDNGIAFDYEKMDIMHFGYRLKGAGPSIRHGT